MHPSDFKRALMESNWFNSLNRCTCEKDQSITCKLRAKLAEREAAVANLREAFDLKDAAFKLMRDAALADSEDWKPLPAALAPKPEGGRVL